MSVKTLYNPAGLSKEELIGSFVVRTKSFERIFEDIKSSNMKYPEKHYLIQGQRGMGKTTLLLRLKYEIENSPELTKWLLPVFFNEESYDLNSLSGLWEKLLKFLDDEYDTNGLYYEHTENFVDLDDYEKRCFEYLLEILQNNGKKLILFFDNFGELFLDNLREKEKRRLREILMHCSELRIIGASAIVLQDLHDYSQPFYEFFQIVHLEGLSKEETYQLIERLQSNCDHKIDLKKNRGKIDTLAILTGGVIRTLIMVYEVLLNDEDGSALNDLEMILDQVTPLYKHRIEDLPIQQRRIVDVIAKRWDAISAKEIATEIREDGKRLQTKLVSAQLAQLEKNNVIEKKQTNTKNHLYQLKERFFNIWYLMRNGDRRDRRKVKWLTKFLEMWYDDEEGINTFIERHIFHLKSGRYHPKSALLVAEALVDSDKIDLFKLDLLIKETSGILTEEQRSQLPDMELKKFSHAKRYYDEGNLDGGIEILEKIPERNHYQKILLAFFYLDKKEKEKAFREFDSISGISIDDLQIVLSLSVELKSPKGLEKLLEKSPKISKGKAFLVLALSYLQLGEKKEAEMYFVESIAENENEAFLKLAELYRSEKNFEGAEAILKNGFNKGAVPINDLIEFYLLGLPLEAVDLKSAKKLIAKLPENDLDRMFFKSLVILIELAQTDEDSIDYEKAIEFQSILEITTQRFYDEKKFDFRLKFMEDNLLTSYLDLSFEKVKAKSLIEKIIERGDAPKHFELNQAFLLIWYGKFLEGVDLLENKLDWNEIVKDDSSIDRLNYSILLLLSKNQFHLVMKLFSEHENLKEILKPTYYALMTLLKEVYPNEVIKMGEELNQPVNDLLERIEEMKEEYK